MNIFSDKFVMNVLNDDNVLLHHLKQSNRQGEEKKGNSWSRALWQQNTGENTSLWNRLFCPFGVFVLSFHIQETCKDMGSYEWVHCRISQSILWTDVSIQHTFKHCAMWKKGRWVSGRSPAITSSASSWLLTGHSRLMLRWMSDRPGEINAHSSISVDTLPR